MYLRCPVCVENGEDAKPIMIAKYYPGTGWTIFHDDFSERLDGFFACHRHDSQWGNGFVLEFEIKPDYPMKNPPIFVESETEPFPRIPKG